MLLQTGALSMGSYINYSAGIWTPAGILNRLYKNRPFNPHEYKDLERLQEIK